MNENQKASLGCLIVLAVALVMWAMAVGAVLLIIAAIKA